MVIRTIAIRFWRLCNCNIAMEFGLRGVGHHNLNSADSGNVADRQPKNKHNKKKKNKKSGGGKKPLSSFFSTLKIKKKRKKKQKKKKR